LKIEGMRKHGPTAVGTARPLLPGLVPIKLDAVVVGVAEVDRFTDAVVRRAFERDASLRDSTQGVGQFRPCRVQDGDMVQASRAGRRRLASGAFPSVQSDVMVITPGGEENGLRPVALCDLKAEHVSIERQRPFQVRHFQMNVADPDLRMKWMGFHDELVHILIASGLENICHWVTSDYSPFSRRKLAHASELVILECSLDFRLAVHHERAVPHNRLGEGFPALVKIEFHLYCMSPPPVPPQ